MNRHLTRMALALLPLLAMAGGLWAQATQTQDMKIYLEAAVFDPLQGPKSIASNLRLPPSAPTERWIVQFQSPLTREQREMLTKEYGLKLTHYIPNQAYLERVPREALNRLREFGLHL